MNTAIYKIKLTPLDRFFFGGENVFGSDAGLGESNRRRSYLVKSNYLPQQTSLLGMLRYQLLAQNGLLLDPDSTETQEQDAISLAGARGFTPDNFTGAYGVISGLSPLIIEDETGTKWQPAPLDDIAMPDSQNNHHALHLEVDEGSEAVYLANFNPKLGLTLNLCNQAGEQRPLRDFFVDAGQVGITMTNRKTHKELAEEDRQEAYYNQTFRKNSASSFAAATKKEYIQTQGSFVFYLTLDNSHSQFQLDNAIVQLGGERSVFQMIVEKLPSETNLSDVLFPVSYNYGKIGESAQNKYVRIVLLSDSYLPFDELQRHCVFPVMNTVHFRYFTTALKKNIRFSDFNNDPAQSKTQSQMYTLLERGSVLYTTLDKVAALENALNEQQAFKKIGYNYFQTIKS